MNSVSKRAHEVGRENGGRGARKELEWKYVSEVEQKIIYTHKIVKQPKVFALIDNVP